MEARLWDLEKSPQTPSLASRLLIFLAATHLERDSSTLCELSYLLLFILLQRGGLVVLLPRGPTLGTQLTWPPLTSECSIAPAYSRKSPQSKERPAAFQYIYN